MSTVVRIDPQLSELAYRCHPDGCPEDRTCCVGLAVQVSAGEMSRIDDLMVQLAAVVPDLRDGEDFQNVFEDEEVDETGQVSIEPRDEEGTCPFLFRTGGRALCSIHAVALANGDDVSAWKPRSCRHWPLILRRRGGVLVITLHPEAEKIGCVAPLAELPGKPSMREAFAAEIRELEELCASG